MGEPKKRDVAAFIFAGIALILFVVLCYSERDNIKNFVFPEPEATVQEDTVTVSTTTIQDVLDFRKEIKQGQVIDSIFLNMPDVILIDILMNHGTHLSNKEIVTIYNSNRKSYEEVLKGARLHETIEKDSSLLNKNYPPANASRDSVRRK